MKLKFEKNKNGEITIKVDGKDFSTKDYIQMIKKIKNEEKIEPEFGGNITEEEQNSVNSMIDDLNNIKESKVDESEAKEEINVDNIPF